MVKFFINAANNGHLRGLAEEMHESTNAIRKELNNLEEAGYLNKEAVQNRISYKANTKHPLYKTLKNIIFQPVIDEVYKVTVVKILDFGAVVEFVPGKEVLLHVSEIAWERVEKVTEYLNLGDQIEVKYMGIDKRTRKQKVSRKVLLERK